VIPQDYKNNEKRRQGQAGEQEVAETKPRAHVSFAPAGVSKAGIEDRRLTCPLGLIKQ